MSQIKLLGQFFIACLSTMIPLTSEAGLSAFAPDGSTLYSVIDSQDATPRIEKIDLTSKTATAVTGPKNAGSLVAIGVHSDLSIWVATRSSLYLMSPPNGEWKQLARAPDGLRFTGGCMLPRTENTLLTTIRDHKDKGGDSIQPSPLVLFDREKQRLSRVISRRLNYVYGISCDSNGQLFFGHDYDLWHGIVSHDGGNYILAAYRCAPLASTEAGIGNTSGEGLYLVTPTANHLLVEVSRAGGSGYGAIYQLPRPRELIADEEGFANIPYHPEDRYPLYTKLLSEAKRVAGANKCHSLTTAPDGQRVFVIEGDEIEVITADSNPVTQRIEIRR